MLKNYNQTVNCSGSSVVGETGAEITPAYFAANINSNGGVSFSQTIANRAAYSANKEVVDADFEEFKTKVLSLYAD